MANRSIGSLTIDMLLKTLGLEQGMDRATRKVKSGSKDMQSALTGAAKGIGAAIGGIIAGFATVDTAIAGFNQAVSQMDKINDLSKQTQISTETLSAWGYAAVQAGSDFDSLASALPKLSRSIAEGADEGSKAGEMFKALGIDVRDAAGNLKSADQILPELSDKFKTLDNATTETALAMEFFGKSGAGFLQFLNLGSDGLKTMEDRARALGIVIDSETAEAAGDFRDKVDDLRAATQGWFTQIAAELLPTLTDLTQEMADFVAEGGDAADIAASIAQNIRDIAEAIRFLGSVGDVFEGLRVQLDAVGDAGNSLIQTLNPANWKSGGFDALAAQFRGAVEQYKQGAGIIEGIDPPDAASPFSQGGPSGRRSRATAEEIAETKEMARVLKERAAIQEKLDAILNGEDKKTGGKKGGKSEAEKEAEALFRAYDSLAASLDQQISLYGETTEAARVRYEVEFGNLVNLDPKLKQYLVLKAEELDVRKALVDQQKEEDELQKKEFDRIERGLKDGALLLEDLGFELALLKMTNEERDTAIQLRGLEAEAVAKYGDAIREANEAVYEEMQRIEIMDGIRDGFSNFFQDVISGTESVTDAFKNMLDDINAQILRRITDNWVEMLFGATGSSAGGASGNWLSIFAGMFGGGRANGGWANANTLYEVNERGLEMATVKGRDYMLTGNSPVHVTPNHKLGGGVQQSNTFVIQGRIDRRTQDQIVQDVGRKTQTAMARNG